MRFRAVDVYILIVEIPTYFTPGWWSRMQPGFFQGGSHRLVIPTDVASVIGSSMNASGQGQYVEQSGKPPH